MNAQPRDIHGSPTLPDAIEAEQALLGALLMKNDCIEAIPSNFEARHFEEQLHRKMFEAMVELRAGGKTFSPITLKGMLPAERVGDLTLPQYMSRLMGEAVGFLVIPDLCAAITSAAARRDLHSLADDLRQIAFEEELRIPDDVAALRQRLAEITQSLEADNGLSPTEAADEYLTAITGGEKGASASGGVPVCLPELQKVISDHLFRPKRLYGLLSSSGEGKTSITLQIIYGALMAGHPVLFLSYDQTRTECIAQMAAQVLGIEMRRQMENSPEHPLLNQNEIEECFAFSRKIFSLPFEVIDCKTEDTVHRLVTYATRFCKMKGNGKTPLVVIDHIGVIKPEDGRADEGTKAKVIGQRLKSLAKDLSAAVLVLQQRSGTGMKRSNPRPISADLYGGEAARQPFDAIFYLYRAEAHMSEQLNTAEDDRESDKIRARFYQTYTKPFDVPIEGTGELGCIKLRFGDKTVKRHVNFDAMFTKYVSRQPKPAQERML
ncbi:helicase DnaB [Agrobacterium rhizogenes]|nr:helicase DnaB [Rhizobium rhizogenes]